MTMPFWSQKRVLFTVFLVFLTVYVIFQARNFILGPRLEITSPKNGETVAGPIIEVAGTARNVSFITLNDRQIFVNDEGKFKESLLPSAGLVILKLVGKDRFGREKELRADIIVSGETSRARQRTSATATTRTTFAPQNLSGQATP